jgi:serine/threonine protein kinase
VPSGLVGLPQTGDRLDEFEMIQELGSGAFARVFLARQTSLGRLVALKVSVNRGQEGRTLASLEHDHIVHVFSETVVGNLRLLCMQYVPGTTLERVIDHLSRLPPAQRTGQALLDAVDTLRQTPATLDIAGLHVRELLGDLDAIEAACWMGARLAEALAHAHGLGVLHRDIKPANILVNPYGRPLLADFNVASRYIQVGEGGDAPAEVGVGGTLAYMAPEHLDAFDPEDPTPASAADTRSDIYSLGVVLFELLTGKLPYSSETSPEGLLATVRCFSRERKAGARMLPPEVEAPPALQRVLARCLAPAPEDRFATAADLADGLDACREARRVERDLPPPSRLARLTFRRPLLMAVLLAFLPHILGSVVNVTYNALRIVDHLTDPQQALFIRLVLGYNVVVYPLCLWVIYRLVEPVFRVWRLLGQGGRAEQAEVDALRQRVLRLPAWATGLACLGWLPGGLLFPLLLDLLAGPIPLPVYAAFAVSFTISGLVALTYSVFGVQFVSLRVLYPRLWVEVRDRRRQAARELACVEGRLARLQFLAVLIPLIGAALLLGSGPNEFSPAATLTFRLLVVALMGLGMVGLGVALVVSARLRRTVAALVGRSPHH